MTDIKARKISDCVATVPSPRLFTVETRAPARYHVEVLRHRRLICEEGLSVTGLGWDPDFSYSVSSTRAVPFAKLVQEAMNPELRAAPILWGKNQRGMTPGDEIDDLELCIFWPTVMANIGIVGVTQSEWITRRECARRIWDLVAKLTARAATEMVELCDVHKSIPNWMISPYTHYNVLMTGTEPGWLNAMGLRLDGAADPIVRALFEQIWIEWNESIPRVLKPGEWALPYADDNQSLEEAQEEHHNQFKNASHPRNDSLLRILQEMSVARCAHLSYTTFETGERMTVKQCFNVYQRLVGSIPIHASPSEHQGTPDYWRPETTSYIVPLGPQKHPARWDQPHLAGNLGPGWIQLRKLLPNEAIAPIPEKYRNAV